MRCFTPTCVLGNRYDETRPQIDKFGGVPLWPTGAWPTCSSCGAMLAHVAQLWHSSVLDLGSPKRALTLFQCEDESGECPTWDPDSGANAALIAEPDVGVELHSPPSGVPILPEMQVKSWVETDDGVPEQELSAFFVPGAALPESHRSVPMGTKVGGAPHWMQEPVEFGPEWRYVLQLDWVNRGTGPAPTPEETGWTLRRALPNGEVELEYPPETSGDPPKSRIFVDSSGWSVGGPNFGFGLAYVFVSTGGGIPRAKMLWQR